MKANELTCKDLMVGDWVKIKISQHNTEVTNIDANSVYTEAAFPIRYDEIEPIPLTPEILKKNFPIANGCQYIDNNNDVCIEVYFNAKTEKYKKYAILYIDRSIIYIDKYVHQLQHALRLCGIEKEIIL